MTVWTPDQEPTVRKVLRYYGIRPKTIADHVGTNSHTVNRVLDPERFESVQHRNVAKVRKGVRELLARTAYPGDIQLLWLEFDDPDWLEELLADEPMAREYPGLSLEPRGRA